MQILREGLSLDGFLREATEAPERILMLDYDGTLSPHRVERNEAVPYPGVRELLEELHAGAQCRTVIVSGRTIADLKPLLGMGDSFEIWGCHGWERMNSGGAYETPDLPPGVPAALKKAAAALRDAGHGDRIETKAAGVAMHTRGIPPGEQAKLERETLLLWKPIAEAAGLHIHEFNGGLEMRPEGMDKGTVVDAILGEAHQDAAVAYLGDDLTDEDAFRAIDGRGLAVLVSSQARETAAAVRIEPPDELLLFLRRWCLALESHRAPSRSGEDGSACGGT